MSATVSMPIRVKQQGLRERPAGLDAVPTLAGRRVGYLLMLASAMVSVSGLYVIGTGVAALIRF